MKQIIYKKYKSVNVSEWSWGFFTSPYFKSDMLMSNLIKMQLIQIGSFSYGKNVAACIYLSELTYSYLFPIIK